MKINKGDTVTMKFVANKDIETANGVEDGTVWFDGSTEYLEFATVTAFKVDRDWKFGDIVTEDDKPSGRFRFVDVDGDVENGNYMSESVFTAPYRLIWLEGKKLV